MGFTKQITIESATGAGVNPLNGRGGLPALSTIAANTDSTFPAVRINQTLNQYVTAYLLDAKFYQTTYNGGTVFVTNQNGVFSFDASTTVATTFPYKLFYNETLGSNTLGYRLSATGQECASGIQIGAVVWTLSSTALSGTSAGTTIPITVGNGGYENGTPAVSAVTQVFCLNTPAGNYICQQDLSRIVQGFEG